MRGGARPRPIRVAFDDGDGAEASRAATAADAQARRGGSAIAATPSNCDASGALVRPALKKYAMMQRWVCRRVRSSRR